MCGEGNCIARLKFPQKLWYLLTSESGAIEWSACGKSILLNFKSLQQYLQCNQSIFKTLRISSFIRQLNLYGFRKVTSNLQDPLISSVTPDLHEYTHDSIQHGILDLHKIRRRTWTSPKREYFMNMDTKTFLTIRVRKARRNFRKVLKRTVGMVLGGVSENRYIYSEDNESTQDSYANNFILPISMQEYPSFQQYLPTNIPPDDVNGEAYYSIPKVADPRSEEIQGTNLSSYIESFSESILDDPSAINESLESTQYSYWESDASMINTQESIYSEYYTSILSSNNTSSVKVEEADSYNDERKSYIDYSTIASMGDSYYINSEEIAALNMRRSAAESQSMITPDIPLDHVEDVWNSHREQSNNVNYQEYGSDLKELYIQISKTVDLLNNE